VLALIAAQEARQAAALAQRVQPVVAAGSESSTDSPDGRHPRRSCSRGDSKAGAERDRQLDHAEPGADVATRLGTTSIEALPHFIGQLLQLLRRQRLDVRGTVDRFENQLGLVTISGRAHQHGGN